MTTVPGAAARSPARARRGAGRSGYRCLHLLLERDGTKANIKRIDRLYREEGLAARRRKRKRVAVARRPMPPPARLNDCWAVDFVSDVLATGSRYRVLNVVDTLSRESLVSEVDTSLTGARVVRSLETLALWRGYPERITCDNGPEFRSRALDAWAYEHRVTLDFIAPGKPIQNSVCESFNGRMRDECLNVHWWRTVDEARRRVEATGETTTKSDLTELSTEERPRRTLRSVERGSPCRDY